MAKIKRILQHSWPIIFLTVWILIFFRELFVPGRMFFAADISRQYFPWYVFTAEKIKQAQLPLWSNKMQAGYPLFAEGETGALYPVLRILFWFFAPVAAFNAIYPLHFFWASMGSYLYLRSLGLSRFASCLSAFSFCYGLFFVTKIIHPSVVMSASWLPWGMYLVHKGIFSRQKYLLALPVVIVCQFFAGHPQIAFISILTYVVYALVMRSKDATKLFLTAVFIGLLIAGVQLLPLWELGRNSARPTTDRNFLFSFSLPVSHLITLALPNFYGTVRPDQFDGSPWYGGAYWEFAMYMGILPVFFAFIVLIGPVKMKKKWSFVFLSFLFLLLAMGGYLPPYRMAVRFLSILFVYPFRVSARFLLPFTLFFSVLAGFGLERFVKWFAGGKLRQPIIKFFIIIFMVSDLYFHGYGYNKIYATDTVISPPEYVTDLNLAKGNGKRIFTESRFIPMNLSQKTLQPNLAMIWNLSSLAIATPLPLAGYESVLQGANYQTVLPKMGAVYVVSSNPLPVFLPLMKKDDIYIYPVEKPLDRFFVTNQYHLVQTRQQALGDLGNSSYAPKVVALEKKIELASSVTPLSGSFAMGKDQDGRLDMQVTTNLPSIFVYLDNFYPSWKVYVDGELKDLLRINGLFKGVWLPAGVHKINFVYEPASLRWGSVLSGLGILLYGVVILKFKDKTGDNLTKKKSQ